MIGHLTNPFIYLCTNSSSGYGDELCFGASWLYRATGENQYKQKALEFYNSGAAWAFSWDSKYPGAHVTETRILTSTDQILSISLYISLASLHFKLHKHAELMHSRLQNSILV